ncbi:membrane protein FxsA [Mycobacterium sp. E2462]|uniref:FxsA family protein n=1 Tax=Mycobacterium sp. E2462 TaxID=1834133 RepID=UPI0007FDCDDC|nr:FxsA family protein [Mycobacterium sp. E2462]OBI21950.1 membrane protein FxsA [Mycobacterium sp. E2462]
MVSRLLLIYAVVEIAVIFALVSTVGWGWTLLVLLGTFLLGWGVVAPMAGSRLVRQVGQLRRGLGASRGAAGDGALIGLGAVLVLIPGLVSTALGLLLLLPPVRSVARPALTAVAMRRLQRIPGYPAAAARRRPAAERDYIDGEVIDGEIIDGEVIDGEVIDGEMARDLHPSASPRSARR